MPSLAVLQHRPDQDFPQVPYLLGGNMKIPALQKAVKPVATGFIGLSGVFFAVKAIASPCQTYIPNGDRNYLSRSEYQRLYNGQSTITDLGPPLCQTKSGNFLYQMDSDPNLQIIVPGSALDGNAIRYHNITVNHDQPPALGW